MASPSEPSSYLPRHLAADEFYGVGDGWAEPLTAELARTALEAAWAGSEVIRAAAGSTERSATGISTKVSETDMVSDVDRSSEAAINDVLGQRRPDDGLLAEEGSARTGTTGVRWVVDPLDGTTNFLFGIPQYAVSVAAEVDGIAVVGVVWDPCRSEIWAAASGHGAFCNGVRCAVRDGGHSLATALVATGFAYKSRSRLWQGEVAMRVLPVVRDLRRLGSAALDLSWLGGGRFDAFYEWGLKPWDLQAGALIASEAGAKVETFPNGTTVATTPFLFDPVCELLLDAGGLDGPEPRSG